MEQRITVDSILDKKFSTVAKGFNQQEVDEYLDQICDEFDRRDAEMNALRQEIAQLKAAQANGSNTVPQQTRMEAATDDSFREILEMAKRVKDQTIADAQTKASQILANAESEARQQLSDLTKQKEDLTAQVNSLKASAKSYYEQAQNALNGLSKLLKADNFRHIISNLRYCPVGLRHHRTIRRRGWRCLFRHLRHANFSIYIQ